MKTEALSGHYFDQVHHLGGRTKIAKHGSCSLSCLITFQAVLSRCATALVDGQERPVDENYKSAFRYACEELGGLGERLVAFCDYR